MRKILHFLSVIAQIKARHDTLMFFTRDMRTELKLAVTKNIFFFLAFSLYVLFLLS